MESRKRQRWSVGMKPVANQASRIFKLVAQTGPAASKYVSGHGASTNVEP